jgi:hypothetical protein
LAATASMNSDERFEPLVMAGASISELGGSGDLGGQVTDQSLRWSIAGVTVTAVASAVSTLVLGGAAVAALLKKHT